MVTGENKIENYSTSNTVQIEHASSILVVHLGLDSVLCGIFDIDTGAAIVLDEISLSKLNSFSYLQSTHEYNRIIISQSDADYELVPKVLLNSANESLHTLQNLLPSIDGVVSFSESDASTELQQKFPGAALKHFMTNFIEGISYRTKFLKGMRLYVHTENQLVHVVLVVDGKLQSAVTEKIATDSDLAYHILSRIEAYKLNQLEDILIVSGGISKDDKTYTTLKKYFKNIQLNKGFKFQKTDSSISGVEKQKFFSIINAFQCA